SRGSAPDLMAPLRLVDPRQVVLDGVFGGDDLDVGPVQLLERGVERGGFSRAGRPLDEKEPFWPLDYLFDPVVVRFVEAELLEVDQRFFLVEDTHHDALPV